MRSRHALVLIQDSSASLTGCLRMARRPIALVSIRLVPLFDSRGRVSAGRAPRGLSMTPIVGIGPHRRAPYRPADRCRGSRPPRWRRVAFALPGLLTASHHVRDGCVEVRLTPSVPVDADSSDRHARPGHRQRPGDGEGRCSRPDIYHAGTWRRALIERTQHLATERA